MSTFAVDDLRMPVEDAVKLLSVDRHHRAPKFPLIDHRCGRKLFSSRYGPGHVDRLRRKIYRIAIAALTDCDLQKLRLKIEDACLAVP